MHVEDTALNRTRTTTTTTSVVRSLQWDKGKTHERTMHRECIFHYVVPIHGGLPVPAQSKAAPLVTRVALVCCQCYAKGGLTIVTGTCLFIVPNPHLQFVCAPIVIPLRSTFSSKIEYDAGYGGAEDSELWRLKQVKLERHELLLFCLPWLWERLRRPTLIFVYSRFFFF